MAEKTAERSSRLDASRTPVAIVHEGFFVYANQAFLDRLAYKTFDDLAAVPLLDLVVDGNHERLREHLEAAKKTAGTDRRYPEARLTFRRSDELPLAIDCKAFRTRYGGEDCIQLSLTPAGSDSLSGAIRDLPWRNYLSLAFLALFAILPSLLLPRLNINNAPQVYFPDHEDAVIQDRELHSRFPNDQVVILVFDGVALFSDGFMQAYDALAQEILANPLVDDVIAVTRQDHINGGEDSIRIDKLIDPKHLERLPPGKRAEHIANDRFSHNSLISRDQSALSMIVVPKKEGDSLTRVRLSDDIARAISNARLQGYLKETAGWTPVDIAEFRAMLSDNMVFIPATVIAGLLLVWWLFRRWIAVIMTGVTIGVVVNCTVAIYVLMGQPFTLISSIIPPMLSALTVAALVHLFNAMYQASRHGLSRRERVDRALREVDRPAVFAALTTAAGLASLGTSPIVPIKAFGLISAIGVGFIYLVVYRVLPNVFARWDRKPWPRAGGGLETMETIVRRMSGLGMRYPLAVVTVLLLSIAVCIPAIYQVKVETNFQEFFAPDHRICKATEYVDKNFLGTMPLEVKFDTDRRDGLVDHEKLEKIRAFQRWAESLPQVDHTVSMVDFIEEMHWALRGENPEYRAIPQSDELISQLLLIYDGNDLYDFVDRDYQHTHVAMNLNVHSANDIAALMDELRAYLAQNVGDSMQWNIAGAGRLFADMEELLVVGQVYSLWGALVLIFLLMLILWRSVGSAALCMIPNLSPILLIFIVMGVFGIWLDMATAMIASVAVGIAVDDTIHVYHGFRHRVRNGVAPVVALARTYREAGRAVIVTTIILSAQFLILVFSDFVPTRNFGLLTTVGLVSALLFDLLLLPALLMIFYGPRSPVARWTARLRGRRDLAVATESLGIDDLAYDEEVWTAERKVALVREILSGKTSVASAAQQYALPETEVSRWLDHAVRGINEALGVSPAAARRDPEKVRALARAYKRLQDENRELKQGQPRS